jgi:hypothetical protein
VDRNHQTKKKQNNYNYSAAIHDYNYFELGIFCVYPLQSVYSFIILGQFDFYCIFRYFTEEDEEWAHVFKCNLRKNDN